MFRKILCASLVFLFFLSPSIASSEELNPLAKGFGWVAEKVEGLKEGFKIRNVAKDELRDQGISKPPITNEEFDTVLQKEYQGKTYSEWFAISKKSEDAYASLQKGEYFETAKALLDVVKAGVSIATGEIPIVFIATAPIKYALNTAVETFKEKGFNAQMDAYFKARELRVSHDRILEASKNKSDIGVAGGEDMVFGSDGYVSFMGSKRLVGLRPMKGKELTSAEEFLNMANHFYMISKEKERYGSKKKEIVDSFAKDLQILSQEEEKKLGKIGQ